MKFDLNEKELATLEAWQKEIKNKFGNYGGFKYTFTPTGIGTGISVYSDLLDESLNITDYDSW